MTGKSHKQAQGDSESVNQFSAASELHKEEKNTEIESTGMEKDTGTHIQQLDSVIFPQSTMTGSTARLKRDWKCLSCININGTNRASITQSLIRAKI